MPCSLFKRGFQSYYVQSMPTVLQFYNYLVLSYLKLQKRAARVILPADCQGSSAALINKLHWIPFYEQCYINKCSIMYERIRGTLPSYLGDHPVINHNRQALNTRCANFKSICPNYNKRN